MKVKIKSTVAKILTRKGESAFISRELVKLELDLKTDTFQPIIEEVSFTVDNNNIRTNVSTETIILPSKLTKTQVDVLFTSLNKDIITSNSFVEQFKELLKQSIQIETQNYNPPLYGILPNEWEFDTE